VRKRPRTPAELKHNDPDVVTVCCPGRVVVNELKSAYDLSKYLQKVGRVFYLNVYNLIETALLNPDLLVIYDHVYSPQEQTER